MPNDVDPYLFVFAFPGEGHAQDLEERVKRFLEAEPTTESLDTPAYAERFGSGSKADYLLGDKRLVAELKTINGDPKDRIEKRLKERFSKPGAPIVFGQTGLSPALEHMSDRDEVTKAVHDLSSRAVRRHLQKANEQASATKQELALPDAAGLAILLNDAEKMIDAANIAYSIKTAMEVVPGGYSHLSYIWVAVEAHRIRLPSGQIAYPQILIAKDMSKPAEMDFLVRMLSAWAAFNGSQLQQVQHNGEWGCLDAIYEGGPPVLALY